MADLTTVAQFVEAFYRLVGMESGDQALEEQGESADDVAYINLTKGSRSAQRWMIRMGYQGWRQRSSTALSFSGTDAADGGQYVALPSDFLRVYGSDRRSAITEANGDRWGSQIEPEEDNLKGEHYYLKGEELWLARTATPPSTVYLDYHYRHPVWTSGTTVDFPLEARGLVTAEAAHWAMFDNWLPGGAELKATIADNRRHAREEARFIVRSTKKPRQFRKVRRFGNRW